MHSTELVFYLKASLTKKNMKNNYFLHNKNKLKAVIKFMQTAH